MFDLVYTDANHVDKGVIQAYSLDAAWGIDENDFQLVMPAPSDTVPEIPFGAFVYIDGTQLGGIVDDKSPDGTDDVATVTYHGRTWHGVMAYSVIQPDAGKDYYIYSGDANDTIRAIIDRQGLGDVFTCVGSSGINVSGRFDRYTDMYGGLMKMLARDAGKRGRLAIWKEPGGKVHVEAVDASVYTDEIYSDKYGFRSTLDARPVNHLICLGEGDLKNRDVVHLYADAHGNVSTTQTLFGIDERTETYDYSNAEHDELVSKGIERLAELQNTSTIEMTVSDDSGKFEVGDIVGAFDNLTGINVEAYVSKVIVRVDDNGLATYSYEVGDISSSTSESSGGGVSMSTLEAGYVKKSGDTMTGALDVYSDDDGIRLFNNLVSNREPPSTTLYKGILYNTKDGGRIGYSQGQVNANGRSGISLVASNASQKDSGADTVTNGVWFYVTKDGERSVSISDPAPWHSALKTKGQGAIMRLYGSGSAAADALTLTTSYQNLFAGKCSSTNAAGNDGVGGIFTADTANGEITVNEDGNYLMYAKVYFYNSFTVGDAAQVAIATNGSAQAQSMYQVRADVAGMMTFGSTMFVNKLSAGTKVSVVVRNTTAARGTCQRYNTSNLTVIKL